MLDFIKTINKKIFSFSKQQKSCKGFKYFFIDEYSKALAQFSLIKNPSELRVVWKAICECYTKLNLQNPELIKVLIKISFIDNKNAELCEKIGLLYEQIELPQQALFWYNNTVQLNKCSLESYYKMAKIFQNQQKYEQMRNICQRCYKENNFNQVLLQIDRLLKKSRLYQEGICFYQKIRKWNKNNLVDMNQYYAECLFFTNPIANSNKSITIINDIIEQYKCQTDFYVTNGIYFRILNRFQQSLGYLKKAVSLDRNDIGGYINLAQLVYQGNKAKQVRQFLLPQPLNIYRRSLIAFSYYCQADYENYKKVLLSIYSKESQHQSYHLMIGLFHQLQAQYSKAIQQYVKYKKERFYTQVFYYQSICYEEIGDYKNSIISLNETIEIFEGERVEGEDLGLLSLTKLVVLYHKLGQVEKRQELVEKCDKIIRTLSLLSQKIIFMKTLLQISQIEKCLQFYYDVVAPFASSMTTKEQIVVKIVLTQCLYHQGKYQQSSKMYKNLLSLMKLQLINTAYIVMNSCTIFDAIELSLKFQDFNSSQQLIDSLSIVYNIEKRCPNIEYFRLQSRRRKSELKVSLQIEK